MKFCVLKDPYKWSDRFLKSEFSASTNIFRVKTLETMYTKCFVSSPLFAYQGLVPSPVSHKRCQGCRIKYSNIRMHQTFFNKVSGTKNILSIFGLDLLSDEVAGHFCHEYHPSRIQNKKQRKHLTLICTSTKNIIIYKKMWIYRYKAYSIIKRRFHCKRKIQSS